jgi:hypothetical protein
VRVTESGLRFSAAVPNIMAVLGSSAMIARARFISRRLTAMRCCASALACCCLAAAAAWPAIRRCSAAIRASR